MIERNMAKSNKEQKFPAAEHILSLNSSANHSALLQNEDEHGSELQKSVCLSQCNVTQIENLLACRISCERFSGCKSREQSTAVGKTFRRPPRIQSADFKANRSRTTQSSHSVSTLLRPSPSHHVYSLFLQHFTTFITQCGVPRCSVHRNCQDFAWLCSLQRDTMAQSV